MSSVRAFLAVPLNPPLRTSLRSLQNDLESRFGNIRWSRPESLHLTLCFFGETPQENLEKIKVSMLSVKRCQRPFTVDVGGLGAFPDLRRPRVLWLGLTPGEPLRRLHAGCCRALQTAGLDPDARPYRPHLTIGRTRGSIGDLTAECRRLGPKPIGTLAVDRLILYESRLHPGGAEHIQLYTVTLDENAIRQHPIS